MCKWQGRGRTLGDLGRSNQWCANMPVWDQAIEGPHGSLEGYFHGTSLHGSGVAGVLCWGSRQASLQARLYASLGVDRPGASQVLGRWHSWLANMSAREWVGQGPLSKAMHTHGIPMSRSKIGQVRGLMGLGKATNII